MEYSNLKEKECFFQRETVNSLGELLKKIQELNVLNTNKKLRFRGVNEAKYQLLSSLQRTYKSEPNEFLRMLLHRVKSSEEVKTYFNKNNYWINDIDCLSLMQHYSLPTPFIDFTTDINVALFFADYNKFSNKFCSEIDDYVSLYFFDGNIETEVYECSLQKVLQKGINEGIAHLEDLQKAIKMNNIDCSVLKKIDKFVTIELIRDLEIMLVDYPKDAPIVQTLLKEKLNISNSNLEKQHGCFILNNHPKFPSLEENWTVRTMEYKNNSWSKGKQVEDNTSGVITSNKIHCIDIRKDVIEEYNKKINRLNKRDIFDNSEDSQHIENILVNIYKELEEECEINSL